MSKEIRCKIENYIYDDMKSLADKTDTLVSILAKEAIENQYKENGVGYFFSLTNNQYKALLSGSKEQNVSLKEYLSFLLDKFLPNDTMHSVVLNVPKGANKDEILNWFQPRVNGIAEKLGIKNVQNS